MTGEAEMTLNQFVESKYFKLLARGCMVLLLPAVVSLATFIVGLMGDVSTVKEVQAQRAADNDRFQATVISEVTDITNGVAALKDDLGSAKLDIAMIRGMLQEMQRRDMAQANARPFAAMMGSAPAHPLP